MIMRAGTVYFLLFILLVSCSSEDPDSPVTGKKDYKLTHAESVSLQTSSDLLLDIPKNIQVFKNRTVLWGEQKRASFFKKAGNKRRVVNTFSPKGRGPGEILKASYYQTLDSGYFAIFDNS